MMTIHWLSRSFPNKIKYWSISYPGGASEHTCQRRRHRRCGFHPWVCMTPWRRAWQPLQYPCLENPKDRGAWWATVHRVTKGQTRLKWLSIHTHAHTHTHTCHQTEIIIVQTLPKMEYQTSQPEITQSTTTWGAWLRDSYNSLKESNFAVTNLFFASCVNNFFQFPLACRILLYS